MAYEYDTLERENSGSAFLMGLLAGTVLGAGLGLLFAPKAGSELRTQISGSADRLRNNATETYKNASDRVSRMMERSREAYNRAKGSVTEAGSEMMSEARDIASSAASDIQSAYTRGVESVRRTS